MSDKNFGVKQINIIGGSGTPTITSPNNLNLNAVTVAISTDVSIGGEIASDIIVGTGYSVGIGTTNPQYKLDVGGDINFTGTLYQDGVVFSSGGSSGVGIQDDESSVGTATTINFGTGLSVSAVSAGIVTVTAIPTNNFYDGGIVTGNIVLTTSNKNQLVPVSTGSSISITLPAGSGLSPGDGFTIVDVGSSETSSGNAATFNITVTPNAADRIVGGTGPLIIDQNGASVKLVWMGSTYDWRIV